MEEKVYKFRALIKKVSSKALVSLDKSYQVLLQGEDKGMAALIDAPADQELEITIICKYQK